MIRNVVLTALIGLILIVMAGCAQETASPAHADATPAPTPTHRMPSMEY